MTRTILDLAKPKTVVFDLSTILNPRVNDDLVKISFHIQYDNKPFNMTGYKMYFISADENMGYINIDGMIDKIEAGDNVGNGDVTFRFPPNVFKKAGTFDSTKTMFVIENVNSNYIQSTINISLTVLENGIAKFNADVDQIGYDSKLEQIHEQYKNKAQELLDELINQVQTANNFSDVKETANQAKQVANDSIAKANAVNNEVITARSRFSNLNDRLNNQDIKINSAETTTNANANYNRLAEKDLSQDKIISTKADKVEIESRLNEQEAKISTKADKNELEDKLSKMKLFPEAFENADAIKKTYPDGKDGIFVAVDTGHQWYWVNGAWKDGGSYQSNGIGDRSITSKMVDDISDSTVTNYNIDFSNIRSWNSGIYSISPTKEITLTSNIEQNNGDSGIIIKSRLDRLDNEFYISLIGYPTKVNISFLDVYLVNPRTMTPLLVIGSVNVDKNFSKKIKISKNDIKNNVIQDELVLLIAVHKGDSIKFKISVSNLPLVGSLTEVFDKVYIPDNLETGKITTPERWNDTNVKNSLQTKEDGGLYFRQTIKGDTGFIIAVKQGQVDFNRDIYITMDLMTTDIVTLYFTDKNLTIPNRQIYAFSTNGVYKTIQLKIPKEKLSGLQITDMAKLLITTHKQETIIDIKSINISNSIGELKLTDRFNTLSDIVGVPTKSTIGSVDKVITENNEQTAVHLVTPNISVDKDNQIINEIKVRVKTPGNLTFRVGTIDQNKLLVNDEKYDFSAKYTGINVFDKINIKINKGQYLFLDISDGLTSLYSQSELVEKILIQDENHNSTTPGYSGMIFYEVNLAAPFEYTYSDLQHTEAIERNSKTIKKLQQDTELIKKQVGKVLVTDVRGNKYKLMIDSTGTLITKNLIPNRVAIFGNSLTKNTGGIGMCASDQYHDYYHYVTSYIKSKNSKVIINDRMNISTWESSTTTQDRDNYFNSDIKPILSNDTDIVILQISDNVNTDEKKKTFGEDAKKLITNILSVSPKAQIYWVYGWFGNQEIFDKITTACSDSGAIPIYIRDLETSENIGRLGQKCTGIDGETWTVTDPGAVAHPGDNGMKAIADRIIANFDF